MNVETEDINSPVVVRTNFSTTVKEYKEMVAKQLKLPSDAIVFALEKFYRRRLLQNDDSALKHEDFYDSIKVYVAPVCSSTTTTTSPGEGFELQKHLTLNKLQKIVDKYEHVITLYITLPDVDSGTYIQVYKEKHFNSS